MHKHKQGQLCAGIKPYEKHTNSKTHKNLFQKEEMARIVLTLVSLYYFVDD